MCNFFQNLLIFRGGVRLNFELSKKEEELYFKVIVTSQRCLRCNINCSKLVIAPSGRCVNNRENDQRERRIIVFREVRFLISQRALVGLREGNCGITVRGPL